MNMTSALCHRVSVLLWLNLIFLAAILLTGVTREETMCSCGRSHLLLAGRAASAVMGLDLYLTASSSEEFDLVY